MGLCLSRASDASANGKYMPSKGAEVTPEFPEASRGSATAAPEPSLMTYEQWEAEHEAALAAAAKLLPQATLASGSLLHHQRSSGSQARHRTSAVIPAQSLIPDADPANFPLASLVGNAAGMTARLNALLAEPTRPAAVLTMISSEGGAFTCMDSSSRRLSHDTSASIHNNSDVLAKLLIDLPSASSGGAGGLGGGNAMQLRHDLRNLSLIGSGGDGVVYRAEWRGAPVAVKLIVSDSAQQLQESVVEAITGRMLAHPHVVLAYAAVVIPVDDNGAAGWLAAGAQDEAAALRARLEDRQVEMVREQGSLRGA